MFTNLNFFKLLKIGQSGWTVFWWQYTSDWTVNCWQGSSQAQSQYFVQSHQVCFCHKTKRRLAGEPLFAKGPRQRLEPIWHVCFTSMWTHFILSACWDGNVFNLWISCFWWSAAVSTSIVGGQSNNCRKDSDQNITGHKGHRSPERLKKLSENAHGW